MAFPLVGLVWVDGGYVNVVDQSLVRWAAATQGIDLVVVARNADVRGFQVLPRRWVVERSFGSLGRCRRLGRDYERKTAHAEAMIKVAMIRLMAPRLAGEDVEPHGPIETEAPDASPTNSTTSSQPVTQHSLRRGGSAARSWR